MPPDTNFQKVGIVGIPPLAVIQELNDRQTVIHDLDMPQVKTDIESTAPYIPKVYCAILRTVIQNVMHLELDAIYIDVGPGKCDSARYVADVLTDIAGVPVIRTKNQDSRNFGNPLCKSNLPLEEKFIRITESVKSAAPHVFLKPCRPTAGFWGVPPRDFSILKSFPYTTHVYGWTRCMENKTPTDQGLENHCNPEIPTVFFAQSFCAKTALARLLARQHPQALYLDCDVTAGSSARAKIQAFLELSGVNQ